MVSNITSGLQLQSIDCGALRTGPAGSYCAALRTGELQLPVEHVGELLRRRLGDLPHFRKSIESYERGQATTFSSAF